MAPRGLRSAAVALEVVAVAGRRGASAVLSLVSYRLADDGCSAVAWGDEAGLVGVDHGLDAVAQPELAEQVRDVRLDRGLREDERGGDLCVGQAGGEHSQHLLLALGQLCELVGCARD